MDKAGAKPFYPEPAVFLLPEVGNMNLTVGRFQPDQAVCHAILAWITECAPRKFEGFNDFKLIFTGESEFTDDVPAGSLPGIFSHMKPCVLF